MSFTDLKSSHNHLSLYIFLLLAACLLFSRFLLPRFLTYDVLSVLSWDVFGYYLYLPAYFIHHDIGLTDFTWVQHILDTYHPTHSFYQAYQGPAGDYVMKYPLGLSILYAPFFFIAHGLAYLHGYLPDGFALPYQVCIAMGGLVYAITGIWFLRKILLRFFNETVTALVMIIIVLGTNFFELTAYDGAMPHNSLFMLFALIVWLTIRWHERQSWTSACFLGLLIGLSILVRPTSGVIILFPLLWATGSRELWLKKWRLVKKYHVQVFLMICLMLAMIFLQLMYWKLHAGTWLYYSYEKNEKLQWIAPYLWKVMFSYKKGWLVYTPVMVFALFGFFSLAFRYRSVFLSVLSFFIVNLLVVSSWPTWWYGGSFGQRALMESYVLLAFPLGAFIQWMEERDWFLKGPVFILISLLLALNLFQTWQYMNFILDPSQMTKKYYWTVFGKTSIHEIDRAFLEPIDEIDAKEFLENTQKYLSRIIWKFDFEKVDPNVAGHYSKEYANSGDYAFKLNQNKRFSPGPDIAFKDLTKEEIVWIRATGFVYFSGASQEAKCGLVITVNQKGKNYKYRMLQLENESLIPDQWNKVTMDYMTPFVIDRSDIFQSYFWYRGDKEMYIDDFEISVFESPNKN